jgi:hypothetical protein
VRAVLRDLRRAEPAAVRLTWTQPLWRGTPVSFFGGVMRMARLADGDLDSVRGVFWVLS